MASAAAKIEESPEEAPEGVIEGSEEQQQSPRDFDAEAREHGWRPKEEFPGDAAKWVDAETFMKRADEVMPLLKAQNARLKREFEAFRKDTRRMSAQIEGAEKRAFDKAKAEIEAKIEAAIETGDLEAGKAALKEIGELKPGASDGTKPKYTQEEALEALDQFRENNSWFDRGNLAGATDIEINARAMFDRIVEKRARGMTLGDEPPPDEFFAACADEVLAKYPTLKGKPSRVRPNSAVEAPGAGRGGRATAETFENLPPEGQRMCDRLIAKGILNNRAEYLKTYDWSKS